MLGRTMDDGDTGGVRAADWLPFGLLLLIVVAWGAAEWHPFLLPNNDYYSFEKTAQSFARLELPKDFKRLPAFPALIAVVRPLMSGPHTWLSAALVVNAASAFGTLVLLFVYARRLFGPRERGAALLVPILFASTEQFHAMALQPLVEPTLGFFLVLAFVLHQRRSLWMYAAGFMVGLGRAEAATVIPVFFLLGVLEDRPLARGLRRHALPAALASMGLLGWTGLGVVYGKGQNFYLELMGSMGWQPAVGFPLRAFSEAFVFLNVSNVALLVFLLALTAVPVGLGVAYGLRTFRSDARVLALYFVVSVLVVAFFGVNKPRYAYTAVWIPLLFCVGGLAVLRDRAAEWLAARAPSEALVRALGVAGVALWLVVLVGWLRFEETRADLAPLFVDELFTVACVGLAAWVLLRGLPPPVALRQVTTCLVLVFVTTSIGSGIARKRTAIFDIYHANHATVVLADWMEDNFGEDDRMVVLSRKHLQFLTGLPKHRFTPFSRLEVESTEELSEMMRRDGLTLVAWTHRDAVENRSAAYYHQLFNVTLAERFRSGESVPGFEHVTTLRVPEAAKASNVQIYRPVP